MPSAQERPYVKSGRAPLSREQRNSSGLGLAPPASPRLAGGLAPGCGPGRVHHGWFSPIPLYRGEKKCGEEVLERVAIELGCSVDDIFH